jgi:hypothetical protein
MTVSTTDIPVLHSTEVAHLYPQVLLPICLGVVRTPYTCTKEARQGSTTRPFQSSTSSRKPATDSGRRKHKNPSSNKIYKQFDPRTSVYSSSDASLSRSQDARPTTPIRLREGVRVHQLGPPVTRSMAPTHSPSSATQPRRRRPEHMACHAGGQRSSRPGLLHRLPKVPTRNLHNDKTMSKESHRIK